MIDNNDKWNDLIDNSFKYPEELYSVEKRFEMRIIKMKKRRRIFIGSLSTVAASLLFVLLVNTSTAFANVVAELPLISNIAELVKFDKSLKKAIENEYVQEVNLVSWDGSNRLLLPYVIADEKNLVLFFQLPEEFNQESNQWSNIFLNNIKDGVTGEKIEGYNYTTSGLSSEARDLNHGFIMQEYHFLEGKLPKSIDIEVDVEIETIMKSEESMHLSNSNEVIAREPILEKIATYNFHIELDEFQQPKIYNINKTYTILGQKIVVESMLVYPTGTEVNFSFLDENTAWIKGLELEVIQDGISVYKGNDGFGSINDIENKKMSVFIESNYFDKPKKQELLIKAVRLLDKDEEYITVDIDNKTITPQIAGTEVKQVIKNSGTATLIFSTEIVDDDNHGMFDQEYKDTEGNIYKLNGEGTSSYNSQMETLITVKYPKDGKVILKRSLTPKTYLNDTVNIEIK
jgi:hypothetical protein